MLYRALYLIIKTRPAAMGVKFVLGLIKRGVALPAKISTCAEKFILRFNEIDVYITVVAFLYNIGKESRRILNFVP